MTTLKGILTSGQEITFTGTTDEVYAFACNFEWYRFSTTVNSVCPW